MSTQSPPKHNHPFRFVLQILLFVFVGTLLFTTTQTLRSPTHNVRAEDYPIFWIGGDTPGAMMCGTEPCSSLGQGGSAPPAPGSGILTPQGAGTVLGTIDGRIYYELDPPVDDDDGGGANWQPTTTPPNTGTPTPPPGDGTIRSWAVYSDNTDFLDECSDLETLKSTGQFLIPTDFYASGYWLYGPNTQTDSGGSVFNPVASGGYFISAIPPAGSPHTPYLSCLRTTVPPNAPTSYSKTEYVFLRPTMTAELIVGFGPIYPWLQVGGGGNTFGQTILSYMPMRLTPSLLFDKTTPGTPGILSSSMGLNLGGFDNISSTNWNTNNGMPQKDWYAFFKHRLSQGAILPYAGGGGRPPSPPPDEIGDVKTYSTPGTLDITSSWTIEDKEKMIVLVEGDLNIYQQIKINGKGFIAFVVEGNITIDGSVGTTNGNEISVVDGVYVAGGTFSTGASTDPLTERFVGKGLFIANQILTQRNLVTVGANQANSADLFLYNPDFLVTAPSVIQDLTYEWQEVAP